MHWRNKDAAAGIAFQAVNLGFGAANAFGLGRNLGAALADVFVRAGFHAHQVLTSEPDTVSFEEQTARQTRMMYTTLVAQAVGAELGGAVGMAVGNVAAPRVATWAAGNQPKNRS